MRPGKLTLKPRPFLRVFASREVCERLFVGDGRHFPSLVLIGSIASQPVLLHDERAGFHERLLRLLQRLLSLLRPPNVLLRGSQGQFLCCGVVSLCIQGQGPQVPSAVRFCFDVLEPEA